jgi:hypothetical protein
MYMTIYLLCETLDFGNVVCHVSFFCNMSFSESNSSHHSTTLSTTVLTMYPGAHSMHLDPIVPIPRRAASSSQLSPSGLGLSLPVPPHLRETFTAENDFSRAGSPALSALSSSFQYHNDLNSAYGSDGSDSPSLHLPVSFGRYRSDRPDAYNRLTRNFLTHQTVRSFSFRYLPF